MTTAQAYYPNTEGLTNESGKPYRYAYKGEGFANKRMLHLHMVSTFLEASGIATLVKLMESSLEKLSGVYPDDSKEELNRKLNVGFFNRTQARVHHDLERLTEEINKGDLIEVIAFSMPFGQVTRLGGFPINKGDLNQRGQAIVGDTISYEKTNVAEDVNNLPTEAEEQQSQSYSGQISTDPLA